MPGNELIDCKEVDEVLGVFSSGGVLFAHGYDERRKGSYKVREFEKNLSEYFQSFATCCSSGTAALYTSLKLCGIQTGEYVAIQSYNFIASVEAVIACNAIPIVVDVDYSLNMCPRALENTIDRYKIKAVIVTNMQGNPVDFNSINKICKKAGITIVEDACQAIGGTYEGQALGTIGDFGIFSFDFGKTITTGEGGVIFTKDPELSRQSLAFVDHGHSNLPDVDRGNDAALNCGFNFRMSELQAAVGVAQLRKLDFIVDNLEKNYKLLYDEVYEKIGDNVMFRTINDPGFLKDGLIFFMPNETDADEVNAYFGANNLSFKNVPSAIKWHSAEYWEHIWSNHPIYSDRNNRTWKESNKLLKRAWSFGVNVLDTNDSLAVKADAIIAAVKKFI